MASAIEEALATQQATSSPPQVFVPGFGMAEAPEDPRSVIRRRRQDYTPPTFAGISNAPQFLNKGLFIGQPDRVNVDPESLRGDIQFRPRNKQAIADSNQSFSNLYAQATQAFNLYNNQVQDLAAQDRGRALHIDPNTNIAWAVTGDARRAHAGRAALFTDYQNRIQTAMRQHATSQLLSTMLGERQKLDARRQAATDQREAQGGTRSISGQAFRRRLSGEPSVQTGAQTGAQSGGLGSGLGIPVE